MSGNFRCSKGGYIMSEVKKVKEFIVPIDEYPVVYESHDIKIAIKVLHLYLTKGKGQHRSILVFRKNRTSSGYEDELVGILTLRDILNVVKMDTGSFGISEMMRIGMSTRTHDLKNSYFENKGNREKKLAMF